MLTGLTSYFCLFLSSFFCFLFNQNYGIHPIAKYYIGYQYFLVLGLFGRGEGGEARQGKDKTKQGKRFFWFLFPLSTSPDTEEGGNGGLERERERENNY